MSRKQRVRRWVLAMVVASPLAFTLQSSSQADEWYPGLPDATIGPWVNSSSSGLSYAKRAKQWFRTPAGMVASEGYNEVNPDDPRGIDQLVRAASYFVSPKGAPANYGYLAPMTVRSVGFGLMPVEATVQVSQRRSRGYPVPLHVLIHNRSLTENSPSNYWYGPVQVRDAFNVRILAVKVDGVDLGLDGNCRTVEPAPVSMSSPAYVIPDSGAPGAEEAWYASHDASEYFQPLTGGGELNGSITIPPFTGCTTTAGDDLSNLMTLSVSGPDNPVSARAGKVCFRNVEGASAPAAPGQSTPKLANCPGPQPIEYPVRPDH